MSKPKGMSLVEYEFLQFLNCTMFKWVGGQSTGLPGASLHKYQNRCKYCHQLDRYLMKITVFQQGLRLLKLAGGRQERCQKIKDVVP